MNNRPKKKKVFSQEMCGSPYVLLLVVLYITFYLAVMLLAFKLLIINSKLFTGAMFLLPFLLLIEDVIAEVYGYKISRLLIWLTTVSIILFIGVLLVISHLPSPASWHLQIDYNTVFGPLLHFVPGTLLFAVLGPQFINIFLITKLKILSGVIQPHFDGHPVKR
jgi:hypothetical protein